MLSGFATVGRRLQIAVVTGASSGIGAELCRELKRRGFKVVGISRRPSPDADEHETCDVSDREAVDAVAASVIARHPRIDLLVNNAGFGVRNGFTDSTPEEIEGVMRTNYLGSVWALRAFLPALGAGSHVVNVVSVAGTVALGPYSSSKHAQLAFSRSVGAELAGRGITVHTVNPGFVETPGFPQGRRFGALLSRFVAQPPFVVERMLHAVDHGKREIVVPRWYRPAAWLQALAPGLVARVLARLGPRGI
ncbi:MAG: SDR family NAD(P)-dependent oxidoreductase [Actinomycetes bacterium]